MKMKIFASARRFTGRLVRSVKYAVTHGWLWLLIPALVLICASSPKLFGEYEPTVRWTGMVLQIFGFIFTLWDMLSLGRLFDVPGWREAGARLLREIWRPSGVTIAFDPLVLKIIPGNVRIEIGRDPNATLKVRMTRVERAIDAIDDQINDLKGHHGAHIREVRREIAEVNRQLKQEVTSVSDKIESALVGGLTLQKIGIVYFIVGVMLASTSLEIGCAIGDLRVCRTFP